MRKIALIFAVVLLVALAVMPATAQEGTVLDIAVGVDDFSILVTAVQNADPAIAEVLGGPGPITVLAPTNQAFRNLAAFFDFELADLLADTSLLTQLLQYHVISGAFNSAQVAGLDGQVVPTLLTNTGVGISLDGDTIVINRVARVVDPFDVGASNGIVHTINQVVFPGLLRDQLAALGSGAPEAEAAEGEAEAEAEEEPVDYGTSITGIAQNNEDFSILFAAIEAAGFEEFLATGGPFTVFAPTNDAFVALLETLGMEAEDLLADTELLATVLRYHVVDGLAPAEVVVTLDGAEVNTILNSVMISDGEPVAVDIVDGEVVLNDGQATVVTTDVEADNGIIHVIDGVLIPQEVIDALVEAGILEPAAEEPETEEAEEAETTEEVMEEEEALDLGNSIAGVAAANENFSLLVAALEATDMVEMLVTGGPFTVFAPTDEAFTALLDSLGVTPEIALGMPELLEPVLLYHVVGGIVLAEDVIASEELPTLLNAELISDGDVITVEVVDGAVVLNDGQATVTDVDIEASNGVIHVIDGVLVPAEVLATLGMS